MANFKDMYTKVQNYINDTSTATLAIIKDEINSTIDNILQTGFWRFALRENYITTVAGTSDYYLPSDLDKILDFRQTQSPVQLKKLWIADYDRVNPNPTQTGLPVYYMETQEDGVLGQPTAAGKVVAKSSSNQDIAAQAGSGYVSLYGVVGGVDFTENLTLSATNVVSSTNSFTKLYSITPNNAPVGTLRFTQATVGTTLLELYPNEMFRAYKKIKLFPIPDGAYNMYFRYQALSRKLVNDADSSIIPDRYSDAITNLVIGQLLLRQGDAKASTFFQIGNQVLSDMRKDQDILWDNQPVVLGADNGLLYRDASYPFSYF